MTKVIRIETARPARRRMPDERSGVTRKFEVRGPDGPIKIYVTTGTYEDGSVGEVFLKVDKQGSLASGALDAVATAISVGLQYGVPLEAYTSKLIALRFEPSGFTGDKKFPSCLSILDLVGRYLQERFGKKAEEK